MLFTGLGSLGDDLVSSTRIRDLLAKGDCEKAAAMLGRTYSVVGNVVAGRGLGRQIGYPTANVAPHHSAFPADGIYVAEAAFNGTRHMAAVNVGYAPTLRHDERTIEAYVLDYEGDLVGVEIEVIFHKRLRGEKKFNGVDELVKAIDEDVAKVRDYFA